MAKMTGEVVPTPSRALPFKVVISHADGTVATEEPVASVPEGEALILELLAGLQDLARKDGYI